MVALFAAQEPDQQIQHTDDHGDSDQRDGQFGAAHANGEGCPGCPLAMEGVTTQVEMTDDGGTFTLSGSSPETIKAVQEWASMPVGTCCKHSEHTDKV